MRNLDQCKQEIFRRSEEKIRKRRLIRNRMIAYCIPLLLCIIVLFAWDSHPLSISKDTAPERDYLTGAGRADGNALGSIDCTYSTAEIQDANNTITVTNIDNVTGIYNMIQELYVFEENVPETGYNIHVPESSETENTLPMYQVGGLLDHQDLHYTITFLSKTSEKKIYILDGYVLSDQSTGQSVILNDDQLTALLSTLNVTE